jgi:hypothetical protein
MFLPITRAAQMESENQDKSELAERDLLMWSMARITVTRFGVPREKKSVVSLKIFGEVVSNRKE